MNVYLDNAASTCVHPQVVEAMLPFFTGHCGNPSSHHVAGRFAREAVETARTAISSAIHSHPENLFFTSGGTEANHLALFGTTAIAPKSRRHIIVSAIEHQSVLRTAEQLSSIGFSVTRLPPTSEGLVRVEDVARAIRPDTFLVSIMLVNNEVGTRQPIEDIASILKPRGILLHTDAVQAFGKVPVEVQSLGVDLMSLSAHKLHGPKGVGALFVRQGVRLRPILLGGGQENGLRSGTENVPAIVGFGKAAEITMNSIGQWSSEVKRLRDTLESSIMVQLPGAKLATSTPHRSPYISNVIFPMVDNSYLINRLAASGICVTSGSACSSYSLEPSHVLIAMGLGDEMARCAIRFSLSPMTTQEEVEHTVHSVLEAVCPVTAYHHSEHHATL